MKIFQPSFRIHSLNEITRLFPSLFSLKITAILLDKDNCITLPHSLSIHPDISHAVHRITSTFSTAILSNSAGSFKDTSFDEATALESAIKIPVIRHNSMKPFCLRPAIQYFRKQLPTTDVKVAIIGDRLFTDVLMGNLFGLTTILVDPLDGNLDSLSVKAMRKMESLFM